MTACDISIISIGFGWIIGSVVAAIPPSDIADFFRDCWRKIRGQKTVTEERRERWEDLIREQYLHHMQPHLSRVQTEFGNEAADRRRAELLCQLEEIAGLKHR